jgi:hypothetical protein
MQTLLHPAAFREAGMKSDFEIAELINQPEQTCTSLTHSLDPNEKCISLERC